ncbi:putative monooxygenase [Mytilinidion resinicola]|uniref:Monooxygenase n=1 Tax=Mytilinidion resinicola TaxID=574789 RepID=A0A6A6Y652_9PEZI|nr:putative monooxygenase [Mytilinidion resinicola]KAF2804089.1 putative monooxygenase [Mytilinidion resinicola]
MALRGQRIAVIGGGIGGMAFMNSALYAGLENMHLYEAAPEFTEVGAGVNITRNANRVLDAFGLKDDMLWSSSRNPPSYMEYRHYRTEEYLGQIEEFGEPRSRQIHRAHLVEVLKKKVPDSKISKGKRLVAVERDETDDCYTIKFQDGTESKADIVVGCDGIKSRVRQHLGFTDEPIYSGQMVYRGYVAYDDLTQETAELLRKTVNFRGPQRHVLTLPIGNEESKTDRVGIIGFMTEPLEGWTSESWLAKAPVDDLYEHVKDWSPAVQEIIHGLRKGAEDGKILKQTLYVRDPTPKWYSAQSWQKSGIILIGDSVHSTLPHQGQGACMAIESGFALAQVLSNWQSADTEGAFQFFQDLRKPRTDKITKTSYETGKLASADIPEELWSQTFSPGAVAERMRWVMEYDLLAELSNRLSAVDASDESKTSTASSIPQVARVV